MRVFAGGSFTNKKGNYPSLKTCDIIKPETIIIINDNKY